MDNNEISGSKTKKTRTEVCNVVVLSVSFFLTVGTFLGIQNVQSSLNQTEGLGVVSLACLYVFFAASGLVAPITLRIIGPKNTIVVGIIVHTIYTACNFYPLWPTLVTSSVLVGLISGPIWTAQGAYITHRARVYTAITEEALHVVLSRFNGIFFGIFLSAQIFANFISSLVLFADSPAVNHTHKDDVIESCGRFDCPNTNASLNTNFVRPPNYVVYTLFAVFITLDLVGLFITVVFLKKIPNNESTSPLRTTIVSCATLNINNILLPLLVPLFVGQSFVITILFADFTKSYVSCVLGIAMVGYVMSVYGTASAIFSFAFGRLAKYTGRVFQIMLVEITYLGLVLGMYWWVPSGGDYVVFFVVAVVWGIGEPVMMTQGIALVAIVFADKQEAGFANFHCWRSVGFAAAFALSNVLCVWEKLITAAAIHVMGMVLYAVVEVIIWREQKRGENREKEHIRTADIRKSLIGEQSVNMDYGGIK